MFIEWEPRNLMIMVGVVLGLIYGVIAQSTRFCVRRAISDLADNRGTQRLSSWLSAIAMAMLGTQILIAYDLLDISQTPYAPQSMGLLSFIGGAAIFGIGMNLTRGCPARLLVLSGQGNFRAVYGFIIVGISGYLVFKGMAATERLALQSIAPHTFGFSTIGSLFDGTMMLAGVIIIVLAMIMAALRLGRLQDVLSGSFIGAIISLAWFVTIIVGSDDFDPIAPQSLSFVAPIGEAIVYVMLASGYGANFAVGIVGGVLTGSLISATVRRELKLETFSTPQDHFLYTLGAIMMGVGGIFALGCSTGQGITGLATLSPWSLLATVTIFVAGFFSQKFLKR